MRRVLLFLSFLTSSLSASPVIGQERVVLHTVAGDVVLGFYTQSAPETSSQLLKLMRAGVFNTTHFFRLEKGFVLQIAQAGDRQLPLTPLQSSLIHRLPLELDPQIKHLTWRLSMARVTEDRNSGETSFSILLGDSPHLDGGYTVFGEVVGGFEAVHELIKVETDSLNRPLTRLGIEGATVFENVKDIGKLSPARVVVMKRASIQEVEAKLRLLLGAGLLVILIFSLAAFVLGARLAVQQLVALHLLQVLIAGFFLSILWIPLGQQWPWFAAFLFAGFLGLFKLMNRFEAHP